MPQDGEIVRCLPYPVLEDGNLSYPRGDYEVDAKPQDGGTSVIIHHMIQAHLFSTGYFSKVRASTDVSCPYHLQDIEVASLRRMRTNRFHGTSV